MSYTDNESPSFHDVMTLARKWYYSEIRSIADEAIKHVLAEHSSDDTDARREALVDWVDETTDGHEYVIYTAKAGMVCAASDNDVAYEDATGDKPPTVEVQACFAMRADVLELLDAREDEWLSTEPTEDE